MIRNSVLTILVLGGCSGGPSDGAPGVDGRNGLVQTREEPAGEHCAGGGIAVAVGTDANGDGTLSEDEVAGTTYVCNAEDGSASPTLIRVDAVSPGGDCADGGVAVRSGQDDNRDGVLDDDEIDATSHICDTAIPEYQSLVRVDDEPPGGNCEYGGVAVHAGLDDDGDGTLDDDEVDATDYVCGEARELPSGTIKGSYRIENSFDVDVIARITEITGSLTIDAPRLDAVELPNLTKIGGDLTIENSPDLSVLDLTGLTELGGSLSVVGAALTSLSGIGPVTSVGDLTIGSCPDLTVIDRLDSLSAVSGKVTIRDNPLLSSITIGSVRALGDGLVIDNNDALQDLNSFGAYTDFGTEVTLTGNALLKEALFPSATATSLTVQGNVVLETVQLGGSIPELALRVSNQANMTTLSLPGVQALTGDLILDALYSLTTVDMSSLASVNGYVLIRGNDDLMEVSLPSLATVKGMLRIDDNDVLATVNLPLAAPTGIRIEDCPNLSTLIVGGPMPSLTEWTLAGNVTNISTLHMPGLVFLPGAYGLRLRPSITSVDFSALQAIEGALVVDSVNTSDVSFPSLKYVLSLTVGGTASLENLDGFSALTTLGPGDGTGGFLQITNNTALVDISGLSGITRMDCGIYVVNNTSLPTCQAANLAALLEPVGTCGLAQTIISGNNDAGVCM